MTVVSDIGDVSITTCIGNAGMGTSGGGHDGGDSGADVTAMSDVGDVAVRTGVGEVGMGKSAGYVRAM